MRLLTQYEDTGKELLSRGRWKHNERTGHDCLFMINANHVYDVGENICPIVTTKQTYVGMAIMEIIGYLRGYDNAAQFREIGVKSWDANANESTGWLANPNRKGTDDLGRVYGVQGRGWMKPNGDLVDQLLKGYNDLRRGIDDRGEIVTFYNPGEFDLGCLRTCMHTHQFSIDGDRLHLHSYQRSADYPLGVVWNQIQAFVLLRLMAQITGFKPGYAYHNMVNVHLYRPQLELFEMQMEREVFEAPQLWVNPDIQSLEDIETWVSKKDFKPQNYKHHEAIAYPFAS